MFKGKTSWGAARRMSKAAKSVKKLPHFVIFEGSLSWLQPSTGTNPEPDESHPHSYNIFFEDPI